MNKKTRRTLEEAGILAPSLKMSAEELAMQRVFARRAKRLPNRKAADAARGARGGTRRWARERD